MSYDLIFRYLDAETGQALTEKAAPVKSLVDCAPCVRAFVLNYDLAASQWIAGEVFDETGDLISRLAYNGHELK